MNDVRWTIKYKMNAKRANTNALERKVQETHERLKKNYYITIVTTWSYPFLSKADKLTLVQMFPKYDVVSP